MSIAVLQYTSVRTYWRRSQDSWITISSGLLRLTIEVKGSK